MAPRNLWYLLLGPVIGASGLTSSEVTVLYGDGQSCVQWSKADLPCPEGVDPPDAHVCSPSAVACPTLQDPATQYLSQGGYTVQSWPQTTRALSQTITITCGTAVVHTLANVGCSSSSRAYLANSCTDGEFSGSHAPVVGESTASAALVAVGGNVFTVTLDTSSLLAGEHRICLDLDGTSSVAKFADIGLRLDLP